MSLSHLLTLRPKETGARFTGFSQELPTTDLTARLIFKCGMVVSQPNLIKSNSAACNPSCIAFFKLEQVHLYFYMCAHNFLLSAFSGVGHAEDRVKMDFSQCSCIWGIFYWQWMYRPTVEIREGIMIYPLLHPCTNNMGFFFYCSRSRATVWDGK